MVNNGEKARERKINNPLFKLEKFTDSKGREILFRQVQAQEFYNKLVKAKESQREDKRWRVDSDNRKLEDYQKDRLYVTQNGSTVAIDKDGDIISVCINTNSNDRG